MSPRFPRRSRRRSARPVGVPIAELSDLLSTWEPDELYALRRRWTARYLPIWYAVYDEVADAAGWDDRRRGEHREAMDHALARADGWWRGERIVQARQDEIESAVSAVTHVAPQVCPDAAWVPQARAAALQVRLLLHFVHERSFDRCVRAVSRGVYDWGELEAWWPASTSDLYVALPAEVRNAAGEEDIVLVYTVAAAAAGLEDEGRAVLAAVRDIAGRLDEDPGPFPVEGMLERGAGDAVRQQQRSAGYAAFHGKERPGFLR